MHNLEGEEEALAHYMDSVGPSGIDLIIMMTADSKLVDSKYSQSTHSCRIKAQIAEVLQVKLTSVVKGHPDLCS